MDEQRAVAYVELIEQLLECPQGQEAELLQVNMELVDAGLVEVMEQVAVHLESQGNGNAGWLRGFAAQLAKILGTNDSTPTQDTARFLLETLQLVAESGGNPQQVYPVWAQQQAQLNEGLVEVMPQVVAQLFAGDAEQRTFVATALGTFGNLIQQFPLGRRWLNLELGIAVYELALQVYTRDAFPEDWAMTRNNLANAYSSRILTWRMPTPAGFGESRRITWNRPSTPTSWRCKSTPARRSQNNGRRRKITWRMPTLTGFGEERADNLEQAIHAYELALQVYTRDAFPEQWATTQNNLANAYSDRIRGERADNLEQAIHAYELALQVYTREAFPKECRQTARNLGNLHFEQQTWEAATTTYTIALAAAETLYQSCILLDGKAAELAATADLPRRVAYALARTGNLEKAVETLEQGRARGLSESLDRDRANLDQLHQQNPTLHQQYKDLTQQLRNLEAQQRDRATSSDRHSLTPEVLRESAIDLRQQLDTLIQQIRQVPGYEKFLTLPTFADVRRAVRRDLAEPTLCERPLAYLVPLLRVASP